MELTLEQLREHFRGRGLKFTSQRYAIYQALASSVAHPNVEDLYSTVKKTYPTLSMNTVYNTLETLKQIGVANEISLWHDKARFDANQSPHHHIVCLGCRKVEDIYDEALDNLTLSPKIKHHYKITGQRIEFHGYCRDCSSKTTNQNRGR